jgi:hypothetical protein
MKGQLLVAQLPILLEQRAAQHGFRRETVSSRLLDPVPAQIANHQTQQRTVLIEPLRDRFQLAADLVHRENIEYSGLDDAFLTHCRAPAVAGFCLGFSGMRPKHIRNRRGLTRAKSRFSSLFQ